ncbi:hypothetical protein O0L34_g11983 [Tuta absoluta]|nr:hypothetical protein O0L34_g11983 [Tuta absoluta]
MAPGATCRCCLLRPPEKDLKTPYTVVNNTEIYADILKECFEIHLTLGKDDCGICEVCIARLRDAWDFKRQVLRCQKDFQFKITELVKDEALAKVKEEPDDIVFMEMKEELSDFADHFQDEDDIKLAEMLGLSGVGVTVKRMKGDKKKKRLVLSDKRTSRKHKKLTTLKLCPTPYRASLKFINLSENKKHKHNIENILKYSNCFEFDCPVMMMSTNHFSNE